MFFFKFYLYKKIGMMLHVNSLPGREIALNIMPYFSEKQEKIIRMPFAEL